MNYSKNIVRVLLAAVLGITALAGSSAAMAYTNPPLPYESGVTRELCDVRNASDYSPGGAAVDKSLRHRIDLFNAEVDGGPQSCLFGIYFLDPYNPITLKAPLKIHGLKHPLTNGLQAGTYISGANQNAADMGVVLDARSFTGASSAQCAVMIEGGLASFQQLHNLTILVDQANKAICDGAGNDLMDEVIPTDPVRTCPAGTLAKDCDYKYVTVTPNTPAANVDHDGDGIPDTSDLCPNDGGPASNGGCPTNTTCIGQTDGKPHTKTGVDADGDGIDAACDANDTPAKPADGDGDGIDDTHDLCPTEAGTAANGGCPATKCISQVDGLPKVKLGIDADGDGIDKACDTDDTPAKPADGDGDGIDDNHDLCPTEAGTAANGGCPATKCISQVDGLPKVKLGIDADGDGIDKACDANDTLSSAPTCSLAQMPSLGGSFDLNWMTSGATTVTLSDGTTSSPVGMSGTTNVTPPVATTYTLTATNAGGSCTSSVIVVPGTTITPAPTCNLSATPALGGGYDLTWLTTNAMVVTLGDGTLTTAVPTSGSHPVNPSAATTYTLTAINSAGSCSTAVTIDPNAPLPPPAPTCSLIAANGSAGSFDLTWLTTNATSVTLSDGSSTLSTLLAGTKNVIPSGSTTYTLVATNASGSCSTAVTLPPAPVPPPPTCNLTYAPGAGNSDDLSWTTSGGILAVTLSDGATTLSSAPSGTHNVTPTVPTTYTLTAVGAGGTCTNAITLLPPNSLPPTSACTLTAVAGAGSSFDLTWSTTGATSVSLNDGSTILSTAVAGMQNVKPIATTTYTLNAIGPGGSCSKSIILTPGSPVPLSPICSFNAASGAGTSFDLAWSTANASTITLSDGKTTNAVSASGTQNVNPPATTIYTLSAAGAGGTCSISKTLPPVTPLPSGPTCSLTAVAGAGSSFDITWSATGTTSVTLTDGTTTLSTAVSGTKNVVPGAVTTYTLNAIGAGGSCSKSIILTPGSPVPASPTCSLSTSGGSLNTFELDWSTTNATTVTLTDGTTTLSSSPLGTQIVTPSNTTTYTLAASGAGGACSVAKTLPPVTPLPSGPTCTLSAVVGAGSSFDLTWTTTGATTVTLSDGTLPPLSSANAGTKNVIPAAVTTYTLTATGSGGSCSKAVTLTPGAPVPTIPTCDLAASAGIGGSFELDWTSANATTVSLSDGTTTLSSLASGSKIVTPVGTTTYTLTATGTGGACTSARTLVPASGTVPPTCTLTSALGSGSSLDLTWTSSGATSVALTDGTTTLSTSASGTKNVIPAVSTTYTLTATNAGGVCSKAIDLGPGSFGSAPTCTLTSASATGGGFNLTWTTSGATSATVSEGATQLSTLLNSTSPVYVVPPAPTQYILTGTNGAGSCSSIALLSPLPPLDLGPLDTDGDGLPDADETNIYGTDPKNPDSDGDGLSDGEEVHNPFYPVCGPMNPDCDNDGICDGPATVADTSGNVVCTPFNGHGDNCELVSNGPTTPHITSDEIQKDSNGNGIGDACEGDADGDGVPDQVDNCPFDPNPDQTDDNHNGVGDDCDLLLALAEGGGPFSGGCSLNGQSPSQQNLLGLLSSLGLPIVMLRVVRRRRTNE